MPKGYRDHLKIIASVDRGTSIGRTSVVLSMPEQDDAVQKRKAKKIPVGKQAEHRSQIRQAQEDTEA